MNELGADRHSREALSNGAIGDQEIGDEELAALALAAVPDGPLPADAVPLHLGGNGSVELLPTWYMPGVARRRIGRWWRTIAVVLVLSFLLIEAAGLCSTYGSLVVG